MAKVFADALRFFESSAVAVSAATVLLPEGRPWARIQAAQALAQLASDHEALLRVLRTLPGGALFALDVVASARGGTEEKRIVEVCEEALGKGRGARALKALAQTGLLTSREGYWGQEVFEVAPPFQDGVSRLIAGLHVVECEEVAGPPAPDRGALALAVLLGSVVNRPRRVTADGRLFRKEEDELDADFGAALGVGGAAAVTVAAERLGIACVESTDPPTRGARKLVVDAAAAEALLARPRAARIQQFAEAVSLPRWLEEVFAAAGRFVSREALARSASSLHDLDGGIAGAEAWLGFLVAAGVLEERSGGVRLARSLRGEDAPEPPGGGRWLVQPNLEILVPPDAPPADVFRLARVTEVASLDRAAVLRLTPASLARAAATGLDAAAVLAILSARAAAPLPDLVVRAVEDHVRPVAVARVFEGTFAVVPAEALARIRADAKCGDAVRAEVAPGVLWVSAGKETAFRKLAERAGVGVEWPRSEETRGTRRFEHLRSDLESRIRKARGTPPPERDEVLAAAVERARHGDEAELRLAYVPSAPRAAAPRPAQKPKRALDAEAGTPGFDLVVRRAILERRDVWLKLAAESRPRLVTPHRLSTRGESLQLEALAHDSGDLRAWPAAMVLGAELAGKSAADHLPSGEVIPLRAARNEKCPCGSNKKYKRCCLAKDAAGGAPGA
jgi:Helicase conserved C-terminal domain/SEC-C motif